MLVSHSLRHSDIVSILTLLPWYPRAADWAIAEMTPKQRGRKDATSYKKMRRHPTSKCCSQISPTTQHSTNDWLLVLGQASHETVNFSPSRGVQWPSDKHVVSLGNPECCFWFDKKVIIIILIIIIITVIIVTSFTKTELTIPQWKKLKSFRWSHANPQIHAFRYTETNITRFFVGIHWDSVPLAQQMCHLVFSCQVTLIAWFGLHHFKYLRGFHREKRLGIPVIFIDLWNRPFIVANYCQPLGTEIDTNQQQNCEYVCGFCFGKGGTWGYLKIYQDTWNYSKLLIFFSKSLLKATIARFSISPFTTPVTSRPSFQEGRLKPDPPDTLKSPNSEKQSIPS